MHNETKSDHQPRKSHTSGWSCSFRITPLYDLHYAALSLKTITGNVRLFQRRLQNNIPPSLIPYNFDSHVFWPDFSFRSQKHHHNTQSSNKTQSFEELKCKLTYNPLEIIGFRLPLWRPGPSHLIHSCWNRKESPNGFALLHLAYVPRLTHCEKLNWSTVALNQFLLLSPWLPNGVNDIFFEWAAALIFLSSPAVLHFVLKRPAKEWVNECDNKITCKDI